MLQALAAGRRARLDDRCVGEHRARAVIDPSAPSEVPKSGDRKDGERDDDRQQRAAALFGRAPRASGQRRELVFLEMAAFGCFHSSTVNSWQSTVDRLHVWREFFVSTPARERLTVNGQLSAPCGLQRE